MLPGTGRDSWAGGLTMVVDRCVKIEHARLFGGLNFIGVNTQIVSAYCHEVITN